MVSYVYSLSLVSDVLEYRYKAKGIEWVSVVSTLVLFFLIFLSILVFVGLMLDFGYISPDSGKLASLVVNFKAVFISAGAYSFVLGVLQSLISRHFLNRYMEKEDDEGVIFSSVG